MVRIPFGPDRIRVAPPTADAWRALASVLQAHGYLIRPQDTDSYNCRKITGGSGRSLHSYGIALDVNWNTNPYIDHKGTRPVRFSAKPTQDERARDVKHLLADTDMTPAMMADVLAIKTTGGVAVFNWGGNFSSVKDAMHFELDLTPADLAVGIDWSTVRGGGAVSPEPVAGNRQRVNARDGLRLRQGPGTEFPSSRTLPTNTIVTVLSVNGDWGLVDLHGDGQADGFVHRAFLAAA